jgi:hypothetical protein
VPGKQDCRRIYQSPGGFRSQPGQDVDRSGDIVKGSRPATADLTSPAVFGHADRISRVGQRRRERPGVGPVESRPPEAAM